MAENNINSSDNILRFFKEKSTNYYNNLEKNIAKILPHKDFFYNSKHSIEEFMKIYNHFFLIKDDLFSATSQFLYFIGEFLWWLQSDSQYGRRYNYFCNCTVYITLKSIEKYKKWLDKNKIFFETKKEKYSPDLFSSLGTMYIAFIKYFEDHWKQIFSDLMKI